MRSTKSAYHRLAAHLVGIVLRPGATYVLRNYDLWEERGFHIVPRHFYSPIPSTEQLKEYYNRAPIYSMRGIDFREEQQYLLLQDSLSIHTAAWSPQKDAAASGGVSFYLNNDAYSGIDPFVYYGLIKNLKPQRIVEIGSGHSTLLGAEASQSLVMPAEYVVIDPWPREFTLKFLSAAGPYVDHRAERVEDVELDYFETLTENDILFVDSSHTVRTGGDVNYIILEVLPRLSPGVVVHFHDIFLPWDYPMEWTLGRKIFWAEQYMLHAFLVNNNKVEVLAANHFLCRRHAEDVRTWFPRTMSVHGGSFWFRVI